MRDFTKSLKYIYFAFSGCGSLMKVISALQKECDILSELILTEFRNQKDVNSKLHIISELLRSSSSKTEHIDPKDIDMLLNQITAIHSRYVLYLRFIHSQINVSSKFWCNCVCRNSSFLNNVVCLHRTIWRPKT